jgi:hypothetical protein
MTPFARNRVGADQQSAAYHATAADPGAENDAEDGLRTGPRAVDRLRHGETVGVVGQTHRPVKRGLEVALQGLIVQARGVGVTRASGEPRHRAGVPMATLARTPSAHSASHPCCDPADRRGRVTLRRRHPPSQQLAPVGVQCDDLDLGSAEVDTDPSHHGCMSSSFKVGSPPEAERHQQKRVSR